MSSVKKSTSSETNRNRREPRAEINVAEPHPPVAAYDIQHASTVALTLGAIFYGLIYTAVKAVGLPVIKYLPLEWRWTMSPPEGVITMGYYGMLLWATIAFLVGFGIGWIPPLQNLLRQKPWSRVLTWSCMGVYAAGFMFYLVYELYHWGFAHH